MVDVPSGKGLMMKTSDGEPEPERKVIELNPLSFGKLDFVHLAPGPSQGLQSKDDCTLKSAAVLAGVGGRLWGQQAKGR